MKNRVKISVIVPVYNVEQYLHRCIDSILVQTFTDFELLLIDDGSTDKSEKICNEYAQKSNNVSVFHKENGGVSSARNLGIKKSCGEWICFVDSDDFIEPDYLFSFWQEKEKHKDVYLFVSGYNYITPFYRKRRSFDEIIYDKENIYEAIISLRNKGALGVPWNKMYNTNIIKNAHLLFDEALNSYEDELFVLEYMRKIEKMVIFPAVTYNYIVGISPNSLSAAFIEIHHHISIAHKLQEEELKISTNSVFVKHSCNNFVAHLTDSLCRLYKLKNITKEQRISILNTILTEAKNCNYNSILRQQLLKKCVLLGKKHFVDLQMKACYLPLFKMKNYLKNTICKYMQILRQSTNKL